MTAPWYRLPEVHPDNGHEPVVVVGAGLAGAAVARALAERGRQVIVLDTAAAIAGGASGNPAGVVKPFVTRDESPTNDFYRFTHRALLSLLDTPGWADRCGFRRCGVLQLVNAPYPRRPDYQVLDAAAASARAGLRLNSPALWFAEGGWLDPVRLCQALLDHPLIDCRLQVRLSGLQASEDGGWILHLAPVHDRPFRSPQRCVPDRRLQCRQVVLATGSAMQELPLTENLAITPARGQLSQFALSPDCATLKCVVSGRHYALPAENSVFVGATFERDDVGQDVRVADHHSNLQGLRGLLPGLSVGADAVAGRAGIRATTPDRLPLLGPAPDITGYRQVYAGLQHGQSAAHFPPAPLHRGLHVFGGLGSRGINVAVGCGQLLASHLCTGPDSLQAWAPLLHPARFCIRALRRAG